MNSAGAVKATADVLAAAAGVGHVSHIRRLLGGRNNQVYRLRAGGRAFVLKVYYRSRQDPRDRLGTEIAFSRFAWEHGIRCLPEPLAADRRRRAALYGFVEGRRLQAAEVDERRVDEALAFVTAVNRHRDTAAARALPTASEACFSVVEHVATTDARVRRLEDIVGSHHVDAAARALVRSLVPLWGRVAARVLRRARDAGDRAARPLPRATRCLSPSDFGFHNALLGADGRLVFHDFEYAGWDDPAKLITDFFCQPQVPVPLSYLDRVEARVLAALGLPPWHEQRTRLLMPVLRVKWCCIALNDFLPEAARRRRFACATPAPARKEVQLATAARALTAVAEAAD